MKLLHGANFLRYAGENETKNHENFNKRTSELKDGKPL